MGELRELQPLLAIVTFVAIVDTVLGFGSLTCCGALFGVALIVSFSTITQGCYAPPIDILGFTIPSFGDYCLSVPTLLVIIWLVAIAFMAFSIWFMAAALKLVICCADGRSNPRVGASSARTWLCFSLFFIVLTLIQYVEIGYRYWAGYSGKTHFSTPYFATVCVHLFFRLIAYIIVRKYAQLLDHNVSVGDRTASTSKDV